MRCHRGNDVSYRRRDAGISTQSTSEPRPTLHCACTSCNSGGHTNWDSALCHSLSRLVLHRCGHTLAGTIRRWSSRSAVVILQQIAHENSIAIHPGLISHRMARVPKVPTHASLSFSRNFVTARIFPGMDTLYHNCTWHIDRPHAVHGRAVRWDSIDHGPGFEASKLTRQDQRIFFRAFAFAGTKHRRRPYRLSECSFRIRLMQGLFFGLSL